MNHIKYAIVIIVVMSLQCSRAYTEEYWISSNLSFLQFIKYRVYNNYVKNRRIPDNPASLIDLIEEKDPFYNEIIKDGDEIYFKKKSNKILYKRLNDIEFEIYIFDRDGYSFYMFSGSDVIKYKFKATEPKDGEKWEKEYST